MDTREAFLSSQLLTAKRRLVIKYPGRRWLLNGLWCKLTLEALTLARRVVLHELLRLESVHDPLLRGYKST